MLLRLDKEINQDQRQMQPAHNDSDPTIPPQEQNKMLSYRRETALQGALVLAKVEYCNWETICDIYYRSVFKYYDVTSQQGNRIR